MTAETIRVTAGHIANGTMEDCESCPIALAILESWGPGAHVEVTRDEIWLWPANGGSLTACTPSAACAFINAFDGETPGPCEPFTFTVEWTAGNYDQEPAA